MGAVRRHGRAAGRERGDRPGRPVLEAVVRLLDGGAWEVRIADLASETGLDVKAVDRALEALTGPYVVDYERLATGSIPDLWSVIKVTAAARRVVGQWPTAESLAERLAAAFSEAADTEQDPERKSRLRQLASFLGEEGKGPGSRDHGQGDPAPSWHGLTTVRLAAKADEPGVHGPAGSSALRAAITARGGGPGRPTRP